jgi:ADP-ribose pyrophosphatase YjhB (NUDIX family)
MEYTIDTHCSYCGTKFLESKGWPRKCFICWNESYKNPIPIVVALVPVFQHSMAAQCSWLIEQRNIEPEKGGWALPSGYVDFNESWEDAVVRELQEEVGLSTKRENWSIYRVVKSTTGNMLIFCTHPGIYQDEIKFQPNAEVSAVKFPILPEHEKLCFPIHNQVWEDYYNSKD